MSIDKKCDYCGMKKNRANFHGKKCHDCYAEYKRMKDILGLKRCITCVEYKAKDSFSAGRSECKPCAAARCRIDRAKKPKPVKPVVVECAKVGGRRYIYPTGFNKIMGKWLSRLWI